LPGSAAARGGARCTHRAHGREHAPRISRQNRNCRGGQGDPNLPGKRLVSNIVDYAPGASSAPHRHARSGFICAYVLSGEFRSQVDDEPARVYRAGESWFENPGAHHQVSANASDTEPARLLAVFIVDAADDNRPRRTRIMSQRLNYNAASPAGVKGLAAVYGYVRQSGLPSRLVDLVFLRVSQINGCAYCIDMHSRDLLKAKLPVEHLVLVAVWPEAGTIFDEQERAALAWAEVVTRLGDGGVPDSAFDVAATVFDEKQLVDLTIAIGLMNAYNRLSISFRTTPKAVAG